MIGFIVNRTAGNGKGNRVWSVIERSLSEKGIPYLVQFTEYQGHAALLAMQMAKHPGIRSVAAVGGDGTVNETAGGLAGSDIPLGYIPAGSGNDYARALRLPSHPLEALDRVLERKLRSIDIGKVGDRIFVNAYGAGFDGEVAKASNGSAHKRWMNKIGAGSLSYAITVVSALRTYQPLSMHLNVDGKNFEYQHVWMAVVANNPYFGGGMLIAPGAANDDGLFHICVVHGLNRLQVLRYFPRIYSGTHVSLPYVDLVSGRHITISGPQRMAGHLDGEPLAMNPAEITMVESGLTVIV